VHCARSVGLAARWICRCCLQGFGWQSLELELPQWVVLAGQVESSLESVEGRRRGGAAPRAEASRGCSLPALRSCQNNAN
jgi:hypothetical protein